MGNRKIVGDGASTSRNKIIQIIEIEDEIMGLLWPSPDGEGGFCAANSRAKVGRGEKPLKPLY